MGEMKTLKQHLNETAIRTLIECAPIPLEEGINEIYKQCQNAVKEYLLEHNIICEGKTLAELHEKIGQKQMLQILIEELKQ